MVTNDLLNHSGMVNSTRGPDSPVEKPFYHEVIIPTQVLAVTWPGFILFGLVANSINIVVFVKSGTKDSVTILLMSLAMSDMTFLALITPTWCGVVILAYVEPSSWPLDLRILWDLLFWPAYTAYDISSYISVSLGLMRCACVTMPLKFKMIFTRSRTIKWTFVLVVVAVLLRIPVLTVQRIARRKNPITNATEIYAKAVNHASMGRVTDILHRGVIMYLSFIIMVVCVIILSFKLYEASRVRRSSTVKFPLDSQSNSDKSSTQRLSSKDLQVIQSVTLVCVIFIVSQIPFVVISIYRLIEPEFNQRKRLEHLFSIMNQVAIACTYMNASLNIFVYYKYNSKYRTTFDSLLCCKQPKK